MESRDFIETFIWKSAEQPGSLCYYVHDFTIYSAKAVTAGNLTEQEWGWWFVHRLPIEYCRHAIKKTGAVADKPSTFVFRRLKQAVELKIRTAEDAKQMTAFLEEDAQNIQLVQELWQQKDELNCRKNGRFFDLIGPAVHRGASVQPPPAVDQELDEMIGLLRSLKLTKTELAVAAQLMPFLD